MARMLKWTPAEEHELYNAIESYQGEEEIPWDLVACLVDKKSKN